MTSYMWVLYTYNGGSKEWDYRFLIKDNNENNSELLPYLVYTFSNSPSLSIFVFLWTFTQIATTIIAIHRFYFTWIGKLIWQIIGKKTKSMKIIWLGTTAYNNFEVSVRYGDCVKYNYSKKKKQINCPDYTTCNRLRI